MFNHGIIGLRLRGHTKCRYLFTVTTLSFTTLYYCFSVCVRVGECARDMDAIVMHTFDAISDNSTKTDLIGNLVVATV